MKTFNAYVMTITAFFLTISFMAGLMSMDKTICLISGVGLVIWYCVARALVFLYGEKL